MSSGREIERDRRGVLLWQIAALGLPDPALEYPFRGIRGTRRWRFDLAYPDRLLAVEIDGGLFSRGRHVRGAGYGNDRRKDCEAVVTGWRVLRITPEMIKSGEAARWIETLYNARAADRNVV